MKDDGLDDDGRVGRSGALQRQREGTGKRRESKTKQANMQGARSLDDHKQKEQKHKPNDHAHGAWIGREQRTLSPVMQRDEY